MNRLKPGVVTTNCWVWAVLSQTDAGLMTTGTGRAELRQLRQTAATICKSGFISCPFLGLNGLAELQLARRRASSCGNVSFVLRVRPFVRTVASGTHRYWCTRKL